MSAKQMGRVFDVQAEPTTKLVLLALADHVNHDGGECWPSVGYLAWKTGLAERTVQYILKDLREAGVLEVVQRKGGGRRRSRVYRMNLEALPMQPAFSRERQGASPFDRNRDNAKGASHAPFRQ